MLLHLILITTLNRTVYYYPNFQQRNRSQGQLCNMHKVKLGFYFSLMQEPTSLVITLYCLPTTQLSSSY